MEARVEVQQKGSVSRHKRKSVTFSDACDNMTQNLQDSGIRKSTRPGEGKKSFRDTLMIQPYKDSGNVGVAGVRSLPESQPCCNSPDTATSDSHIESRKTIKQFYVSLPQSPASDYTLERSESRPVHKSTHSCPTPSIFPSYYPPTGDYSPATSTPHSPTEDPSDPSSEGLFDLRQYSHLNLSEQQIREKIKRHADWIRLGERGFLSRRRT